MSTAERDSGNAAVEQAGEGSRPETVATENLGLNALGAPAGVPSAKIVLTPEELAIFEVLREAVAAGGRGTVLRVAGGWVRDKLLGLDSNDIDIALDNVLGREFAESVCEVLKRRGDRVGHLAVIRSNPEQSKHLETATMKVLGTELDFVNLRAEEYADTSRVPTVRIGSPLEDAQRRDLTINAMFYNINEGIVEDFTGVGITDLDKRVARTPLDPVVTFKDDPLRILRTARFASRYALTVVPEVLEAAGLPEVRECLRLKVSRERVGKELDGLLDAKDPVLGLCNLLDRHLFRELSGIDGAEALDPKVDFESGVLEGDMTKTAQRHLLCARGLKGARMDRGDRGRACDGGTTAPAAEATDGPWAPGDPRRCLYLSSLLAPFSGWTCLDPKGKKRIEVGHWVVAAGLKLRTREAELVNLLSDAHGEAHALAERLATAGRGDGGVPTNVELGTFVRRCGVHWVTVIEMAIIARAAAECGPGQGNGQVDPAIIATLDALAAHIERIGIARAWEWRPLVDGKEVAKLLDIKGRAIGAVNSAMMDWQLENPGASADSCREWLLATRAGGAADSFADDSNPKRKK